MGRELSSFTDLQRSLSQLGFNSGNVLIKLSFRTSETPLEEAMGQIEEYFKETETSAIEPDEPHGASTEMAANNSQPKASEMEVTQESESTPAESSRSTETEDKGPAVPPSSDQHPTATESRITSSSGRPLQVFAPPTSTTPSAALTSHNPADYTLTIEHAQKHQRLLSESSRNVRLPSEAEIAAKAASEQEKLAAIKEVEIKIRFPDESAISIAIQVSP
jgi:tether containing UBX domain for GLUT4